MTAIYVPSKGRSGTTKTIPTLVSAGVQHYVVLEQDDWEGYHRQFSKAISADIVRPLMLPELGRGLGYARNFIMAHAAEHQFTWHWQLDDDISQFLFRPSMRQGKLDKVSPLKVLDGVRDMARRAGNVAMAGPEYRQYAWSASKPYVLNSYIDVAMGFDTALCCAFQWREGLKTDRDYALQLLTSGFYTLRSTRYAFSSPQNAIRPGGLHDTYMTDGEEERWSKEMVSRWPAYCTFNRKKDGRPDVKVNWKAFQVE